VLSVQLILDRSAGGEAKVEQQDTPWLAFLEQCGVHGFHTRPLGRFHHPENREPEDLLLVAISRNPHKLDALPVWSS